MSENVQHHKMMP